MHVRRPLAVVLVAAASLAVGCGAEAGSDVESADFSQPEQRAVAAAVQDLSDAAGTRDYDQLCEDTLAAPLVKRLDDARDTDACPDQLERSLRDVSDTDLAVRQVRISGKNAVAVVQPKGTGDVEAQARLAFAKEGSRWKLSGIG